MIIINNLMHFYLVYLLRVYVWAGIYIKSYLCILSPYVPQSVVEELNCTFENTY